MKLTININENEAKILKRRAKRNFLTLREQVEDIVRRSCVHSRKGSYRQIKVDDKLVAIFSRERRGRPRKPKKRKK